MKHDVAVFRLNPLLEVEFDRTQEIFYEVAPCFQLKNTVARIPRLEFNDQHIPSISVLTEENRIIAFLDAPGCVIEKREDVPLLIQ